MKTTIFACIHNAGRSQMAAAISAGTNPGPHVHPIVVDAMREVGIDLSSAHPQLLTDDLARNATLLITMGCGEACPYLPNLRREDWPLPDPKNLPIDQVRIIREEIRARVQALLASENLTAAG
jgi:arsenate reductase